MDCTVYVHCAVHRYIIRFKWVLYYSSSCILGGIYNNASYMLDGVMLSERGMQHLKSLTIEKDR